MAQAVIRLGIVADDRRYGAPARSIALLHERGYLDNEMRRLLDRMRNLRNAAAHPSREMVRILPDEAREFIALSEAVSEKLRDLKG